MSVSTIFFNDKQRLRSGWRVALFLAAFLVLSSLIIGGVVSLLMVLPVGFTQETLLFYAISFSISTVVALILSWIFGKYLEGLPFRALGAWFTKNWFKDLIFGFVTGAATICFCALIAYLSGGLRFEYNNAGFSAVGLTLGISLLIFIGGAASEETFFRGYIFQTLTRAKLGWFAVLFTSVLFAAVHADNPGANYLSLINTFIAGLWFAVAYLKTRTLWMPFGIHLAWNWFLGSILGIQVSGISDLTTAPLLKANDFGPAWLTGGDYGLEGGLACTIAIILSIVLLWFTPFIKPTEEMLELTNREKDSLNSANKYK